MEEMLLILVVLLIVLLWFIKRRLNKRKTQKSSVTKPSAQKSESAPSAAAISPAEAEKASVDSASAQSAVDRRQPGVVDRRQHAAVEQKAEPAPATVREPLPSEKKAEDRIPEDSVLRRHYLANLQAEREARTNPYPTDSTLRRHYDAMVKIQLDGPSIHEREENVPTQEESRLQDSASGQSAIHSLENEITSERESSSVATYDEMQAESEKEGWVPEDSVLRRHYLAHIQAEREALANLHPTDSALRREHESMMKITMEGPTAHESERQEPAIDQSVTESSRPEVEPAPSYTEKKTRIPEDSVLKRHFLASLQADIESGLPKRPTDSVLKRHHDALVCAKMAERLAKLQA